MRVLVATTAGAGHFGPLVPFAQACAGAGHEVGVAAPASFGAAVEQAGLRHLPVDDPPQEELAAVWAALPRLSLEEANTVVVRDVFAGIDARAALSGMAAVAHDFRPDLVLRETTEFASYVIAETHRIPHVQIAIGLASIEAFAYPLLDDALAQLGSRSGVEGLYAAPNLTVIPPRLEAPDTVGGRTVHRYRYQPPSADGRGLPSEWGDPDVPLVYATFGTVAANVGLFPGLYRALIDAMAGMPIRVLLTVGEAADPNRLGPLPRNVHVEQFWPQQEVMAEAASIVGHGGFGTTMLALSHGVPIVNIPLFALDQHHNALAVTRAGAGITLEGGPEATGALGEALHRILTDASYRSRAQSIAADMARLPPPSMSVSLLEDIAQG